MEWLFCELIYGAVQLQRFAVLYERYGGDEYEWKIMTYIKGNCCHCNWYSALRSLIKSM
jgi:hypothetical protein